jgi:hypothetical protein
MLFGLQGTERFTTPSKAYNTVYNHVRKIDNKKARSTNTNGWAALKCSIDGKMTSLTKFRAMFLAEQFPDCDIGMRASAGPFSHVCLSWVLCHVAFHRVRGQER